MKKISGYVLFYINEKCRKLRVFILSQFPPTCNDGWYTFTPLYFTAFHLHLYSIFFSMVHSRQANSVLTLRAWGTRCRWVSGWCSHSLKMPHTLRKKAPTRTPELQIAHLTLTYLQIQASPLRRQESEKLKLYSHNLWNWPSGKISVTQVCVPWLTNRHNAEFL